MARRKGWGDLSPSYRKRLSNAGISRSAYESGATIKGARGHARTREHAGKAEHIKKHDRVTEQWVVGPRENGEWYRSDVLKVARKVKPNSQGQLRIAISGTIEETEDTVGYKGRRFTDEDGETTLAETTVGQKITARDIEIALTRAAQGRYRVDMAEAAEIMTSVRFVEVFEISIATGAPPQGKTR